MLFEKNNIIIQKIIKNISIVSFVGKPRLINKIKNKINLIIMKDLYTKTS